MKALGIVVLVAVGGVLAQGVVALTQSPALQLDDYEVVGNQRVSEQELIEATGVEPGRNLLTVSTSRVVDRLTGMPWIRRARVERILPSKLRILVVERTARAVIRTASGPYLVDGQGLVLQPGNEDLVFLENLPVSELAVGERIEHRAFRHAWQAYESLPQEVRVNVESISALTVDQVKFNLNGGPEIFYGAAEQTEEKNRAIKAMLERLGDTDAGDSTVDVRVPSHPTLRDA